MLVKDIFSETIQLVKEHKLEILKNTILPIALLMGCFILFLSKFQGIMALPKDLIGKAFLQILGDNLLYILLLVFLYIRLLINSYRMAILGTSSVSKFGLYLPGMRELKFMGYSLGLTVIYILLILVFGLLSSVFVGFVSSSLAKLVPFIIIIAGSIILLVLSARLYLVFPGIAADKPTSFSDAWRMSKGYVLKIMVITLVFPFVTSFVASLVIKLIPPLNYFLTYHLAGQLMVWSVKLLFFVFMAMLIGMTFKTLTAKNVMQEIDG